MASVWIGKLIWFLCLKNAELTKLVAINIEYKYELVRLWDVHLESKLFTLGQYLEKKYIYRFECTCKYVASIKQNTDPRWKVMHFFIAIVATYIDRLKKDKNYLVMHGSYYNSFGSLIDVCFTFSWNFKLRLI